MTNPELREPAGAGDLRAEAVARLRKRRDFGSHLLAYVLVNLFLNGIWWATTPGGFYWPIIPMLGWGIGLVFHAWDVYVGSALGGGDPARDGPAEPPLSRREGPERKGGTALTGVSRTELTC